MSHLWVLAMAASVSTNLPADVTAWRAEKDRELGGAESPLAYLGFRTVPFGTSSLGNGPTDRLRFESPGLPEHVLELQVLANDCRVVAVQPLVALDGQPLPAGVPTPLHRGALIEVGPLALRFRGSVNEGALFAVSDRGRPQMVGYHGLNYLPFDEQYRVPATFEPAASGRQLTLQTTQHGERQLPLLGTLHFTLLGQPLSLSAFLLSDHPKDLFVIFRDATNGKTSYGAGRFLWVKGPPEGQGAGKTTIDFNQAWNPLCAYSDAFNCPLAPPENRLAIPIPVGEGPYSHP